MYSWLISSLFKKPLLHSPENSIADIKLDNFVKAKLRFVAWFVVAKKPNLMKAMGFIRTLLI